MDNKICNTCDEEKPLNEFSIRNKEKNTYHNRCKKCSNKYAEKYRNENNDIIKKKQKSWYNKKGKTWKKEYEKNNRERIRKHEQDRYKNDFNYRIKKVLRTRLNKTVKGIKLSKSIISYIGISLDLFKKWIEYQFDDKMNWDNYGSYWDLDHVMPCNSFDLSKNDNVYLCYNWTNLQPLEKKENYIKNKIINYDMCMNQINKILKFESLYMQYQIIEVIQLIS